MKSNKLAAALFFLGLTVSGSTQAASIDYIFSGTFDGTFDGRSYVNQPFSVTLSGNTADVVQSGSQFTNVVSSAVFTVGSTSGSSGSGMNEVGANLVGRYDDFGFAQSNSFAGFAFESFASSVSTSYALDTAFPKVTALNSDYISTTPATFVTSAGNLVFNNVESLSFQAEVLPTPLPSSFGLFAGVLGIIGVFGYVAKRKGKKFSA